MQAQNEKIMLPQVIYFNFLSLINYSVFLPLYHMYDCFELVQHNMSAPYDCMIKVSIKWSLENFCVRYENMKNGYATLRTV